MTRGRRRSEGFLIRRTRKKRDSGNMKENKQHLPKNSAVPPFLLGKMIFVSFVLGAQNLNLVIALFFSPSHSQNGTPISPPSNHVFQ